MKNNRLPHLATLAIAVIALTGSIASAQKKSPQKKSLPPTHNEVVYATIKSDGADRELHVDLWLPQSSKKTPLVLWIHGGGWAAGSHNRPLIALKQLLDSGFAVASVEYRLSGEATAPAQLHDVKGAVRFLRANAAEYNLDPDAFVAWGSSAGGHITALLATSGGVAAAEGDVGGNLEHSSAIQAAVDYFGPTDLLQMTADGSTTAGPGIDRGAPRSAESRLIGFDGPNEGLTVLGKNLTNPAAPFPEMAALVRLMNPIEHVTADDPPMFIAHGDKDLRVPLKQSIRLQEALNAAGVECELLTVEGAGHGWKQFPQCTPAVIKFLEAHLQAAP